MKQTEILTHATHVNGWEPAVYMSCMSQNFRLFHVSNLSVRNFRIFLLMYPGSLTDNSSTKTSLSRVSEKRLAVIENGPSVLSGLQVRHSTHRTDGEYLTESMLLSEITSLTWGHDMSATRAGFMWSPRKTRGGLWIVAIVGYRGDLDPRLLGVLWSP